MEKLTKRNLILSSVLIFIFISLFITNSYPQQHWRIISKPTSQNLWKCSFVDTLNGWAIGDSGTILYTSNGGYNWVQQNSKLNDYMITVFFLNKRLGWALAWGLDPNYYGTYMLKTTNGGIVWDTARYPVNEVYIRDIIFLDSLTGYIGGTPSIFHKTTNGGMTWTKCNLDSNIASGFPVRRFRFLNSRIGVAVGGVMDIAGIFWKTTNFGQFWNAYIVAPEPISDIKLFDSVNYVAVGGDYEYGASVLRTSNGGLNWNYKTLEFYGIPQALDFRTNTEGWAPMGYLPAFIITTDVGNTWVARSTPDSVGIFDLIFKSSTYGIGVGLNGNVIKYFSRPTFSISGTVKYNDNNLPVSNGKVKAFRLDNSSGKIIYLDSTQIQPDGSYSLTNVPQDSVDIGVFPNSTPPNDWIITYYPSTIYWQEAVVLYPTGNLSDINIRAIRLIGTNANNSVSGKIIGNTISPLVKIKDAFIFAKNGNEFVRSTISDSNGDYRIMSLPSGNLKILVNRLGYTSDSTYVNVTSTSNIDSVDFYLTRLSIGIKQIGSSLPSDYKLYQNYPNPFNPKTNIRYTIPTSVKGEMSNVKLVLYNILGKEIAVPVNEKQKPGIYEVTIDASMLPSGIYFYKLIAGDPEAGSGQVFTETKRMVLIK